MFDFLSANKEWLFEGVGATLIVGAAAFLARLLTKARKKVSESTERVSASAGSVIVQATNSTVQSIAIATASAVPEPVPAIRTTNISVQEISQQIDDVPPLQRAVLKKSFEGLYVAWEGWLRDAYEVGDGLISLTLGAGPEFPQLLLSIRCKVPVNRYRELGILRQNAKIFIRGRIASADKFDVTLEDVELSFP